MPRTPRALKWIRRPTQREMCLRPSDQGPLLKILDTLLLPHKDLNSADKACQDQAPGAPSAPALPFCSRGHPNVLDPSSSSWSCPGLSSPHPFAQAVPSALNAFSYLVHLESSFILHSLGCLCWEAFLNSTLCSLQNLRLPL